MATAPMFVLVGHCGADAYSLTSAIRRAVPDAKVVTAGTTAALAHHASGSAVLLINRMLDGDFEADNGIELIRQLASGSPALRMVLISNYADAQAAAVAAGASQGFGKSHLSSPSTLELLRSLAAGALSLSRSRSEAS